MSTGTASNIPFAPLAPFAHAPLLLLITACLMLQPLSTDLYLASLPSLASGFKVPAATVQLTLSLFVLGFGSAQLIIGPLSDRFGRRPVLLWGLGLYLVATLLCSLAPSIHTLIIARFLQALGACSGVVIARAMVRDAYAVENSAHVIAKSSTWLSLAPLAGPILGSYLQVAFGWRAAFTALALFAAWLLALCIWRLPETNQRKDVHATDVAGLARNYRMVLGSASFWAYALPGALSYGAVFAFISGSSFALISVLQVPTAWFGYCFAFGVSGYLLGTILCRRLLSSVGVQRAFRIGTAASMIAGLLFMSLVISNVIHWALVVGAMFLVMGAHGINFPVAQSGAVAPFPRQAGTAAGLMGALNMTVAFVVGTAVGATHDGSLLPLAVIVGSMGVAIFSVQRLVAFHPSVAAP
jgi:DHA1 family bicyclomycin/chloramphenicol resistance-like MFS transporter